MCTYCMVADDFNSRFWQPFKDQWVQPMPAPSQPYTIPPGFPWNRDVLKELEDVLKRVEALENKLGPCPCPDESKLNFIKEIRDKLDEIEKRAQQPDGGSAI